MFEEETLRLRCSDKSSSDDGKVTNRVLPVHTAQLGCPEGTHSIFTAPASELYGRK